MRVGLLWLLLSGVYAFVPICTEDEDLQARGGVLVCVPIDCYEEYGPSQGYFNPATRLCQAPPTPTPRPTNTGATPTPSPASNGTKTVLGIVCIHGEVVCGISACTCKCDTGWQTSQGSTGTMSSTGDIKVYCNATTANLVTQGQKSDVACTNSVQCFFVDQLPFALIVLAIVLAVGLCATCCLHRFCCPTFPLWSCLCWPCAKLCRSRCCSHMCRGCCQPRQGDADDDDEAIGVRKSRNRRRADRNGDSRSTMEATTAALVALLGPMLMSIQPHAQQPTGEQDGHSVQYTRKCNRRMTKVDVSAEKERAKTAVPALALTSSLQQQQAYISPRRWSMGDASAPSARPTAIAIAPSPRINVGAAVASKPILTRKPQAKMAGTIPSLDDGAVPMRSNPFFNRRRAASEPRSSPRLLSAGTGAAATSGANAMLSVLQASLAEIRAQELLQHLAREGHLGRR